MRQTKRVALKLVLLPVLAVMYALFYGGVILAEAFDNGRR